MEKKIAKIGIIMVLTIALILSSLGGLPFGDTFAKQGDVDLSNDKITAQAAETLTHPMSSLFLTFEGSGTVDAPYEIETANQLADLSYLVNNGNATYGAGNVHYKLTANIVLNAGRIDENSTDAKSWTPIGTGTHPFLGAFDGDGHTVSGIYINSTAIYQGLFGYAGSYSDTTATIKNVGVINSYIKGKDYVGGVIGVNYGEVTNCYNTGAVSGTDGVGGVVGWNDGAITNCYNTGAVSGTGEYVGGVIGINYGAITNCYNTGAVSGDSDVGGVVGYSNRYKVTNCYNTGAVSGDWNVGGVVGCNGGTTTNCYNTGAVSGYRNVGGVVGGNFEAITNCYNTGAVSGDRTVGGVVGDNYDTITNCYNTGAVSGDREVGGVAGVNFGSITNCYNTGTVDSITDDVGGVVGLNFSGAVANCYFLKITDGINEDLNAVGTNGAANGGDGVATNCSPFGVDKRLTTAGGTAADDTNKVLVTFKKDADLLATLNAGRAKYNELNPTETQATEWNKGADDYPTFQAGGVTLSTPTFGGSGTVDAPYEISTAKQLADLSYLVNNGKATYGAENVHYKLTKDIVLNAGTIDENSTDAKSWTPIGTETKPFFGTFDGQGFTVSGIYINSTAAYQGLFGYVVSYSVKTSTIKNVGVINSYIKGKDYVGGVVGKNDGCEVINCYNTGAVSGTDSVGGVVGWNHDTIINCYNTGAVSGTAKVGGVVGYNSVDAITNCYNTGAVSGTTKVGGVVGDSNRCKATNCYNIGAVSGTTKVGGVVGNSFWDAITNCYNRGAVTGRDYVGGVVGYNIGRGVVGNSYCGAITNCYNIGAVSGTAKVGGVVGWNNEGAVANCYFLKITDGINKDLNAVGANNGGGAATNCSPFGVDKRLTTAGGTAADGTNKVLVTFKKDADLLATLNAGRAKYNELNPTETQATEWNKDADDYPTLQVGGATPPTPSPTANLTWLWILLAVIAVGAVVVIIVAKKKKNDDEEEKEEDVKNNKE